VAHTRTAARTDVMSRVNQCHASWCQSVPGDALSAKTSAIPEQDSAISPLTLGRK
jgi:hypothetical protein